MDAATCTWEDGWLDRWQQLYSTAEELQRVRCLQREMVTMREEMMDLANRVTNFTSELKDRSQLDGVIQKVKAELTSLLDRKADLLRFNVAVHRYHTDTGHPARLLKDDVADLYRVWDDIVQRVTQQLAVLQRAAQTWQQFDTNMTELQGLLCNDRMTLHMLDAALRGGQLQPEVARVLSEKQEALCQVRPSRPLCLAIIATASASLLAIIVVLWMWFSSFTSWSLFIS